LLNATVGVQRAIARLRFGPGRRYSAAADLQRHRTSIARTIRASRSAGRPILSGERLVSLTAVGLVAIALAITFGAWFASERTLSIHTIFTSRRESFYWLAILFTFALGTAAGDLTAEKINLGYLTSAFIFAGSIALVAFAHYVLKLNAVLAFWLAYILTRPLGASIGGYLSQPTKNGGLGLGTSVTSYIFLGTILALVVFLTRTRRDATEVARPGVRNEPLADAA